MTNNIHIPLKITLPENNGLYAPGNINIEIALGGLVSTSTIFHYAIFDDCLREVCQTTEEGTAMPSDDLLLSMLGPMGYSCPMVSVDGDKLRVEMNSSTPWTPGSYTLYMKNRIGGSVYKTEFSLNARLKASVKAQQECPPGSIGYIMADSLTVGSGFWKDLTGMPGGRELRMAVLRHAQQTALNELRESSGASKLFRSRNFLLAAPSYLHVKGYAYSFLKLMQADLQPELVDASRLYDSSVQMPYEKLDELCSFNGSRAILLYNLGPLSGNGGKHIVSRISTQIDETTSTLTLCGTPQELSTTLDVFPSLRRYFPRCTSSQPKDFGDNYIRTEPPTARECADTFFLEARKMGLDFSADATARLTRVLLKSHAERTFARWSTYDFHTYIERHVMPRFVGRNTDLIERGEGVPLTVPFEDVDTAPLAQGRTEYDDAIAELNQMVGLDNVKHAITTAANRMRFFAERRRLGLATTDDTPCHAIFTGNPGTGKTTVARMLGRIYHSLGLLSRGNVVCVDRTRMIGRFIGETEENMKHILAEAKGNVLLVDEAYTLHSSDNSNDFGRNALECLLTVLSQKDPDMLIIFAGYEKEMDRLMSMNPGLVGRFTFKYKFADYDAQQLLLIAERLLSRDEYKLTPEARQLLQHTIEETSRQRTRNFGNARWVEQYVEGGIVPALADRLAAMPAGAYTKSLCQTIEAQDIEAAYRQFNPRNIELKPRSAVGFSA